jgi:protein Mpv17
MGTIFGSFIDFFLEELDSYPLITKCFTAAFFITFFDLGLQQIEHRLIEGRKEEKIDFARTLRIVAFLSLFGVPVLHFYYLTLEFFLPGVEIIIIFLKVLIDIFLFTPFTVFAFFVGLGLLEGMPLPRIQQQLEKSYWSSIKTSFMIFPVVSFFNFFIIPIEFRLFFIGGISLLWNGYLSFVKHNEESISLSLPVSILGRKNRIITFPGTASKVSVT